MLTYQDLLEALHALQTAQNDIRILQNQVINQQNEIDALQANVAALVDTTERQEAVITNLQASRGENSVVNSAQPTRQLVNPSAARPLAGFSFESHPNLDLDINQQKLTIFGKLIFTLFTRKRWLLRSGCSASLALY